MKKLSTQLSKIMLALILLVTPALNIHAQLSAVSNSGLANIGRGAVGVADFDNDGILDLLLVGQTGDYLTISTTYPGTIAIYKGNGDGTFTVKTSVWFPSVGLTPVAGAIVGVADYDNDGYVDFAYAGRTISAENKIYLFKNNLAQSTPVFTDVTTSAFSNATTQPTGIYTGTIDWGDVNNDGYLDLLVQGRTYSSLAYPTNSTSRTTSTQLFINSKGAQFTNGTLTTFSTAYGQAKFADLDNDGDLDLSYSGGGNIGGFQTNDGTGNFSNTTSTTYAVPTTRASDFVYGDFNNDGKLDILRSQLNSGTTHTPTLNLYANNNTSTAWANFSILSLTSIGVLDVNIGNVSSADYDNDGDVDYTIQGSDGSTVSNTLYLNDGTGAVFTKSEITLTGLNYGSATWADFNKDGKIDLLTHGYTDAAGTLGSTILYLNATTTANSAPTAPTINTPVSTTTAATLSWNIATDDHTPAVSLTYNLYVRDANNNYLISPQSDLKTGFHRTTGSGKISSLSYTLNSIPAGTYYWSVQAIDGAYKASEWAPEGSFTITDKTTSVVTKQSTIDIKIYPNPFTDGKIKIEVSDYKNSSYTITSLAGSIIVSNKIDGETTEVDLSKYARGSYIIRIITPQGVSVKTITKL